METYRANGLQTLSNVINKNKNVNIIERKIYEFILISNQTDLIQYYNEIVMDIYIKLKQGTHTVKQIFNDLTYSTIDWGDEKYNTFKKKIEEYDLFLEKPFEIEDGVIQCNRCGSKQTYSYTKQTRSGDEATTVFSICSKCNAKWKT